MVQSNIILTQTFLDIDSLKRDLVCCFFEKNNFYEVDKKASISDEEKINYYKQQLNKGVVLNFDFSQKKDFRESLSSFYYHRDEPTIVFLGDLTSYSTQLQEGMLRFLEEPPQNLNLVLFSRNKSIILSTISSRSNIISLDNNYVIGNLDSVLSQNIKKKFPALKNTVLEILSGKRITGIDYKQIEREDIDFWLWQLISFLEVYFLKKGDKNCSKILYNLNRAMLYNSQNLQKRFVIESITFDN